MYTIMTIIMMGSKWYESPGRPTTNPVFKSTHPYECSFWRFCADVLNCVVWELGHTHPDLAGKCEYRCQRRVWTYDRIVPVNSFDIAVRVPDCSEMTYLANTWKETHTPRHEGLFFKHFPTQKSIPTTRFGRHREFSPKSRPSRYFIYKQVRKCLKGLTTLPYTVDGGKSMRIHPDAGNISDIFQQKWGTRKLVCPWLKQTPDICIATTNQYAKVNNS